VLLLLIAVYSDCVCVYCASILIVFHQAGVVWPPEPGAEPEQVAMGCLLNLLRMGSVKSLSGIVHDLYLFRRYCVIFALVSRYIACILLYFDVAVRFDARGGGQDVEVSGR
jgi:hypothetical protein